MEYPITPISAAATSGNPLLAIDGLNDYAQAPSYQTLWVKDGKNYTTISTGKWASDQTTKRVLFTPQTARYIRLEAIEANGGLAVVVELVVDPNKNKIVEGIKYQ